MERDLPVGKFVVQENESVVFEGVGVLFSSERDRIQPESVRRFTLLIRLDDGRAFTAEAKIACAYLAEARRGHNRSQYWQMTFDGVNAEKLDWLLSLDVWRDIERLVGKVTGVMPRVFPEYALAVRLAEPIAEFILAHCDANGAVTVGASRHC